MFAAAILEIVLAALFSAFVDAQQRKVKKEIQDGFVPDNHGKLISDSSQTIKMYDVNGNVIEEVERSIWPIQHKLVVYSKKRFFGSNGRLDSMLTFVDDKFSLKLQPEYDSTGRELAVQETNSERKPGFRSKNMYDSANRKSRVEMYDSHGKLYNFRNFSYDSFGNLGEESGSEQGTPRYRWTYRYDKSKRLIERRDYSGQGLFLRKHRYLYNKENRLIKETTLTPKGIVERVVKYRYEYY